ncbi:MAG: four helix bundle protein [Patescibacteria group bacterium]
MKFKFENLEVWNLALEFTKLVRTITGSFPVEEKFNLTSQINRAALSVALNLAEGSGRKTKKDFANFVRMGLGSLPEVVAAERIALAQGYKLDENQQTEFDSRSQELYFKLIALEKYLRK